MNSKINPKIAELLKEDYLPFGEGIEVGDKVIHLDYTHKLYVATAVTETEVKLGKFGYHRIKDFRRATRYEQHTIKNIIT